MIQTVEKVKVERIQVDPALLESCPQVVPFKLALPTFKTNRDLYNWIKRVDLAYSECNLRHETLIKRVNE